MKRQSFLRCLIVCGLTVCILCAVSVVTVLAIDTPWLPLQPDSETTPEPLTDAPEPLTDAPEPLTDAPGPVTEAPEPLTDAPEPLTDAPKSVVTTGKRGCKGTITGWALFIPVSFAVIWIDRRRR